MLGIRSFDMIEYFVQLGTDIFVVNVFMHSNRIILFPIFVVKDISMDILVSTSIPYYDGDNTLSPS